MKLFLCTLLFISLTIKTNAQDYEHRQMYIGFDTAVNINNTSLINGTRFTDIYRSTKQKP